MKKVAIIMGSDSDWPTMKAAARELKASMVGQSLLLPMMMATFFIASSNRKNKKDTAE